MSRRQLVPTALRNELTEYTSLLRALRISRTLDVTAHLTQPREHSNDRETVATEPEETVAGSSSIDSNRRKPERSESPHWRKRDQWTRWPIPAKDVPPPNWSLQDEVETVIKQVLTSVEPEPDAIMAVKPEKDVDIEHDSDSDDEDAYMQDLAELVTPVIENYLESVFALICAHTIARPDSMQNRIEPFDWRDLVNILGSPAAAHLVDETILQNVTTRMHSLFETTPASTSTSIPPPSPSTGPSQPSPSRIHSPSDMAALHRHRLAKSSRSRLNNLLSKHTSSLFEQTLPSPRQKYLTLDQIAIRKQKSKRRTHHPDRKEAIGATVGEGITRSRTGKEAIKTGYPNQDGSSDDPDWTDSDDES